MVTKENNYFMELSKVDFAEKIEKKLGLSYISWAYAWGELKKLHPTANSKVYEMENGRHYFDDGKTAWVKVSVTVEGVEHIEYFPILSAKSNASMPIDQVTSFNVNTSIQRAITKCIARHGLGLYVYAGEDIPNETEEDSVKRAQKDSVKRAQKVKELLPPKPVSEFDNSGEKVTKAQYDDMQDLFSQSIFSINQHGVRNLAVYLNEKFGARNFNDIAAKNFDKVCAHLSSNLKGDSNETQNG